MNRIVLLIIPALLLLASCATEISAPPAEEKDTADEQIDAVIKRYIELMRTGAFMEDTAFFETGSEGKIDNEVIPIYGDEWVLDWEKVLTHHREVVTSGFGEDAWDHVTYRVSEKEGFDFIDGWLEVETGSVIDEEEMIKRNTEGKYTYQAAKIPTAQLVRVYFEFNGAGTAKNGDFDYRITITNSKGSWLLHSALSYEDFQPEPDGD